MTQEKLMLQALLRQAYLTQLYLNEVKWYMKPLVVSEHKPATPSQRR
jgi:hypothetical protein